MERQGGGKHQYESKLELLPAGHVPPPPPPAPLLTTTTTPGDAITALDKDLFLRPAWGFGYACESATTTSGSSLKGSREKRTVQQLVISAISWQVFLEMAQGNAERTRTSSPLNPAFSTSEIKAEVAPEEQLDSKTLPLTRLCPLSAHG